MLTGCGTSEHAAQAGAALLAEALGPRAVVARDAFEASLDPQEGGVVVGVSHEAGTAATLAALRAAAGRGARTVLVTAHPERAAEGPLVVGTPLHDTSWCHTVGYLSPLLAFHGMAGGAAAPARAADRGGAGRARGVPRRGRRGRGRAAPARRRQRRRRGHRRASWRSRSRRRPTCRSRRSAPRRCCTGISRRPTPGPASCCCASTRARARRATPGRRTPPRPRPCSTCPRSTLAGRRGGAAAGRGRAARRRDRAAAAHARARRTRSARTRT